MDAVPRRQIKTAAVFKKERLQNPRNLRVRQTRWIGFFWLTMAVNLAYVKSVENLEAVLTTGERVPISQPKRKEFMAELADFWGDML